MGKLKAGKCKYCGEKIKRHDGNRVMVEINDNVQLPAHLSCHQKVATK